MFKEFLKGLWKENPVLVLMLGCCPTLATTTNAENALSMGIATAFVLVCSNIVISAIRKAVPRTIRIPCYIVVIAAFVTVADLLMQAYAPEKIYQSLGVFIPLITVNCIVLGRAEAFASKNGILRSALDGLGMGCGFTLALVLMGGIREFLACGSIFRVKVLLWHSTDFALLEQAPGGFVVFGFLLAGMNCLNHWKAKRNGEICDPPLDTDCRHCHICFFDKDNKS